MNEHFFKNFSALGQGFLLHEAKIIGIANQLRIGSNRGGEINPSTAESVGDDLAAFRFRALDQTNLA